MTLFKDIFIGGWFMLYNRTEKCFFMYQKDDDDYASFIEYDPKYNQYTRKGWSCLVFPDSIVIKVDV